MTPGQLLREARRRHGVTQAQLATQARTSQAAISRIERDLVSPSVATLGSLLDLVNERLELSSRPIVSDRDRDVLRENLSLTPEQRIEQMAALVGFVRGRGAHRFPDDRSPTLHFEIARILHERGNRWMTTAELADAVRSAGRYVKKDGSPVTDFQIHGRTKTYPELFERRSTRVRLASPD